MPRIEQSLFVAADPQVSYNLAKNMERYPDFMPDVNSVSVIERSENRTVTEWDTNVDGTPFMWTEEDLFDDEAKTIAYRLLEGDLEKFEGVWKFSSVDGGTQVSLTVDYDFGLPELEELIGPTLHEKVEENTLMMLTSMKKEIEGSD